ncbi:MAG: membrane protein insertion efficiency factor YidD [Bacteroidota bacterium]
MKLKINLLLFIFIFTAGIQCSAQNSFSDISLIRNKDYSDITGDNNRRSNIKTNKKEPLKFKHKSFIAKYNPLGLGASALMLLYQHIISPQFFRYCLYEHSCSDFSKAAISEFGLIKGIFMSADRLLRCNISAIHDIPSGKFDSEGYAIDEPEKYHIRKK